jgi:hypothetical protein
LRINSSMKYPILANGSESSGTGVGRGDPGGPDVKSSSGILRKVE